MIAPLLKNALEPVVSRERSLRTLRSAAIFLFALAAAAATLRIVRGAPVVPAWLAILVAIVGCWLLWLRAWRWQPDYRAIARRIEHSHPELHAVLLTAVEQKPEATTGRLGFLQQRVLAEAIALARRQQWIESIPGWKLAAGFAGCAGAAILLFVASHDPRSPELRRQATTAAKHDAVEVTPGDASIERGSGLIVLATFYRDAPSEAVLILQPKGQPAQRIPLMRNLNDPAFGGGVPEVDADLTYHVDYAGKSTRDFKVSVFEHPRLERADADLHFPEYTKLPEKKIPNTRRVSAVEGSKLNVAFQLNKEVKTATLVAKDGTRVPLAVQGGKPVAELREFPMRASQTYELKLEDADGRTNKVPAQFVVEALPNRKPELKFQTPKGDQRVSPIEEVAFRAEAWDDFGLARYGLTINVAGRGEKEVELGRETHADERREVSHLLKLEELGVKPDELISWFLWAEDTAADGQPRRTATDMFFAEVRPFEEIFHDGGNQEGGGGGGEEQSKLAEVQKQIITATWNLKRGEEPAARTPSEKYRKDEPVVRDAQAEALKMAEAMMAKIESAKGRALLENAMQEMQSAHTHLTKAEQSAVPLPEALTAEQAAYNALLKLAAHEFRVVRAKGKGKGGSKQQAQLDELEMKEEKKRYETKRGAESQQDAQQRAQLALLNLLKELAQRQNDINERLKELQNALQAAQTEKEKEEIKRQLKRLREEEQQLLADMDELREKMEKSPEQTKLADERKELDKARAEAQQAADAIEKKAASQALASGTRAAADLQKMREDFRKKTSGQFNDEMRQMRTDARELAQNQQAIADKLAAKPAKVERRSLDATSEREQLGEKFEKQQGDLGKLTANMQRVSEQAEAAEPLLAKELYDALRKTAQAGTGTTLANSERLAHFGNAEQAQQFEAKARGEIEELKSGIERAAGAVLGDETQALRQARAELDGLTAQLNREIAQARPASALNSAGDSANPAEKSASGETQKPGEAKAPGNGKGEGQGEGEATGEGKAKGKGKGQGQGEGQGEGKGQGQGGIGEGGAQTANSDDSRNPARARLGETSAPKRGGIPSGGNGGGSGGGANEGETAGPITGENFTEWSDRLRNVEEMIDDPGLRTDAARVREIARGVRAEFKRHSVKPNWDLVNAKISAPLAELRDRLTEELARRESKENLVPIDRDPVPAKYAERVRRYYEELGKAEDGRRKAEAER